MSSKLFSPITIGPVTLENRIAVAPMCQYSSVDGSANSWHLIHLGNLALSGAALVMIEATGVEDIGRITPGCLGLYSEQNEAALSRTLENVREHSRAKFGIQLGHAGRKASSHVPWLGGKPLAETDGAWETIAPSAIPFVEGGPAPREMTGEDLDRVEAAFVEAARRAVRIGFDVIELHAAHGYLLHQFLSPLTNLRQDQYGGSPENRMRFPLRVFRAMREACPSSVAIGARITGSDWDDNGITPDDAASFVGRLAELGCAYVDVTSGGLIPTAKIAAGPGYQVPFAAHVRQRVSIPVRAVGMITTPHQAEAIIAEGKADMVALARAMLADPRWPWRAAHALGVSLEWPAQYRRATPASWFAA